MQLSLHTSSFVQEMLSFIRDVLGLCSSVARVSHGALLKNSISVWADVHLLILCVPDGKCSQNEADAV